MAKDKEMENDHNQPEARINKLEVSDILDIYKTRILSETKQEFFVWLKRYTLIFMLIAWLVSLVGVGYIVEKVTEERLDEKVTDIEKRSKLIIDKNVERLATIDASIVQVSQLAVDLKMKLAERRKELDETSGLIRAASQDSAGQFLRYERLIEKIGGQFSRLYEAVFELAANEGASSVMTDLKIFNYEIQSIFEGFHKNGRIYIDLATRLDSSIDIPVELAYWLSDRGFAVRQYSKVNDSALKVLYGENYHSLITASNFVMIKYSEGNESIMEKIVARLKVDPYFKDSKYDISKSNGESISSFVSVLF